MMESLGSEVLSVLLLGAIAVVWYLLQRKDAEQGGQIKLLFSKSDKHNQDVQDLKVQLAREHYQKPELDTKFQKIEEAIEKGMDKLGAKFDKLSDALLDHIAKEDGKK